MNLKHGDVVANNSSADCGKFFFVLNPCRPTTTSLDGEEADKEFCQAVVQNMEDKHDFRYVNHSYFDAGIWYVHKNNFTEVKE